LASLSWGVDADTLKNILDSGTLRVGVSLFTPWTMKNEFGQLSGLEIDVANKLAEDIGVKPKFNIYQWDQIIAALIKREIDVIAGDRIPNRPNRPKQAKQFSSNVHLVVIGYFSLPPDFELEIIQ
jgi:ABC-type amino acid transport substrate-binding protein